MNIRKVGRVKATEVKAYQMASGLQVDGKVGNQTFGHLLDTKASLKTRIAELEVDLALCRQPDDPGSGGGPVEVNIWLPIGVGAVIAALIVLTFI